MNSVATVHEQYCYSDNCLPETREKKRKEKKKGKTLKSETQTPAT